MKITQGDLFTWPLPVLKAPLTPHLLLPALPSLWVLGHNGVGKGVDTWADPASGEKEKENPLSCTPRPPRKKSFGDPAEEHWGTRKQCSAEHKLSARPRGWPLLLQGPARWTFGETVPSKFQFPKGLELEESSYHQAVFR